MNEALQHEDVIDRLLTMAYVGSCGNNNQLHACELLLWRLIERMTNTGKKFLDILDWFKGYSTQSVQSCETAPAHIPCRVWRNISSFTLNSSKASYRWVST